MPRQKQLAPRQAIVKMDPYRPPSSGRGGKMRLDFNENTVGCSPRAARCLAAIGADAMSVYPEYEKALPALARHFGVNAAELTLTNGTDEAIQLIVNTFVDPRDEVIVLAPSYAMYRFYAQVMGARVNEVAYAASLAFPEGQLLAAITSRTRAIFIANPNNPTGTSASPAQLQEILRAAPRAAVLVDEAYFEFYGKTVLPWLSRYPNLFVSRTFSKAFGLAGLRIGCLFSNAANIAAIRKGQSPYSVNMAAVTAALEAVRDDAFTRRYVREVLASRTLLIKELERLGWKYFPSDANFILVNFGSSARRMRHLLNEHEILVRDRSYEIEGCVRITVGTRGQTRKLIQALRSASSTMRKNDSGRSTGLVRKP